MAVLKSILDNSFKLRRWFFNDSPNKQQHPDSYIQVRYENTRYFQITVDFAMWANLIELRLGYVANSIYTHLPPICQIHSHTRVNELPFKQIILFLLHLCCIVQNDLSGTTIWSQSYFFAGIGFAMKIFEIVDHVKVDFQHFNSDYQREAVDFDFMHAPHQIYVCKAQLSHNGIYWDTTPVVLASTVNFMLDHVIEKR